jgi:uncharacterized repeat protein (TIGR03803 family)
MTNKSFAWLAATAVRVLAIALAVLFNATGVQAGENVILRFNKTHGSYPSSGLTSDSAGNLYGTTTVGGAANCGTAFELSPGSGGKWTQTVLYSFKGCQFPGPSPFGTMVFDKVGNLYGAAHGDFNGSGLVFELSKGTGGTWSESVIHSFSPSEGGPSGDLTWDSNGNLYGTTSVDATGFDGEVFELSPQPDGSWKETVLYAFPSPTGVGFPTGGVVFDNKGNLYGPTFFGIGGSGSYGAIYELSPQANGPWTLTIVYNATSFNGSFPSSRLTFDSIGNLYGTTNQQNYGEVFELSPTSGGGQWKETTIHSFASGSDGRFPQGTLIFDASGNLYGTATYGGLGCNQSLCGVVYRLTPQSGGIWKETILHQFESAADGSEPQQGLLLDNAGHLFGTTSYGGGRYGYGTVFEINP